MNRHGISLFESTFWALLIATTVLTPVAVSAQSIPPGEPSARAPIAIAQNSAEVKPNIDKLIPVPDTANVPPPTLADIKDATPPAPAVTVAPPTPNPIPASAEAPALDPAAPTATLALPE